MKKQTQISSRAQETLNANKENQTPTQSQETTQIEERNQTPSQTPEAESTPIIDTSNWKTYTYKKFSFKYPQDWEIKEEFQISSAACQVDPTCTDIVHYVFVDKISDKRSPRLSGEEQFGIAINLPQCTGVQWDELPGNNWICLFDPDPEVRDVFYGIEESFQSK